MVAETRRGLAREHGAEHVRPRRHGIRARPPRRERVGGVVAGHADGALGLGVVRLELVVVDRPVDDVGALDRSELGSGPEIDLAQARQLAVGVEAAAADRRREVVHVAGEDPIAVLDGAAERPRLE